LKIAGLIGEMGVGKSYKVMIRYRIAYLIKEN
jgi:hypothetical protein